MKKNTPDFTPPSRKSLGSHLNWRAHIARVMISQIPIILFMLLPMMARS